MPKPAGESGTMNGTGAARERRADWPDFLRRILLGASLAGSAATASATPIEEPPPGEVAEADRQGPQG